MPMRRAVLALMATELAPVSISPRRFWPLKRISVMKCPRLSGAICALRDRCRLESLEENRKGRGQSRQYQNNKENPRHAYPALKAEYPARITVWLRFRAVPVKTNRGTALTFCFYALSYAKPLRTFAENALAYFVPYMRSPASPRPGTI
jgi:hypothetical protein